ncbi:hypothetical protein GCM10022393_36470 [Aquimarina addita]|uniref:3-oxoacyl-ACP synthase n=1 Tax=Aquimarina addita TaxID=870485 RepID=A0ABP6UR43_9FLAO
MQLDQIKEELLRQCQSHANQRLDRIIHMIANIEESLSSETKSSAGDKHETGRAVIQLEREKAGAQLAEVQKVLEIIAKINITAVSTIVRLGSLVTTSQSSYFLSASVGKLIVDEKPYFAIAANTPIGKLILGKKIGDHFSFNGNRITIKKID